MEETLLPVCQERKILLQAYSPLEQGVLTEQFRQKRDTPDQKRFVNKPWGKKECHERMLQMFDSWMDLCEKYNCQLEHLAIAWILKQPGVNILCGARKITHLESNIKGAEIALTEEDTERIRKDVESFMMRETI
jgi:methylglyoxal reductase